MNTWQKNTLYLIMIAFVAGVFSGISAAFISTELWIYAYVCIISALVLAIFYRLTLIMYKPSVCVKKAETLYVKR